MNNSRHAPFTRVPPVTTQHSQVVVTQEKTHQPTFGMGPNKPRKKRADGDAGDGDDIVIRVMEAVADERVILLLQNALYPQALIDQFTVMNNRIDALTKDLREHLNIKLLRYLTYALNHCNPIVKKFSDIALGCALSPMGANIALLRYLYDVSFDRKLLVNEQSICNFYKIHSDSERYATVGVLRDLINCRDGIHVIDYYNYDDITGIIDELCTN